MADISNWISSDFFDQSTLLSLDEKGLDELRGHLILLNNNNSSDISLKVSALIDGSSIDFLFGLKRSSVNSTARSKLSKIKALLLDFSENPYKQKALVDFYIEIYLSSLSYHNYVFSYGLCCYLCLHNIAIQSFERRIDAALIKLKSQLK